MADYMKMGVPSNIIMLKKRQKAKRNNRSQNKKQR